LEEYLLHKQRKQSDLRLQDACRVIIPSHSAGRELPTPTALFLTASNHTLNQSKVFNQRDFPKKTMKNPIQCPAYPAHSNDLLPLLPDWQWLVSTN
jgi:hypothetical protein